MTWMTNTKAVATASVKPRARRVFAVGGPCLTLPRFGPPVT